MRAFVAIEVGDPLDPLIGSGHLGAPSHLTLRFLGEVAEDREEPIAAALRDAVAQVPPFDLTLEGVGAFPSPNTPRVVWVGVTTGREQVIRLASRVSDALVAVGFPPEHHDLVPHLTLFRVRNRPDRHRARLLIDGTEPPPASRTVRITEIVLKESTLARDGPVHRTRGRFPLSGGPIPGN